MQPNKVWLIVVNLKWNTFEVNISDSQMHHKLFGKYSLARNVDCSIALSYKENDLFVNLVEMKSGGFFSRRRWVEGDVICNGTKCGACRIENNYGQDKPLIEMEVGGLRLVVKKTEFKNVISPLYVSGFEGCEFILADKKTIMALPQLPPEMRSASDNVVGLFCANNLNHNSLSHLNVIAFVAAITEIHVNPYYMSVGP